MRRLAVITGMVAEADCLATAIRKLPTEERPLVHCAGGSAARAQEGALRLAREGVHGLVSFGIAGGLDPSLAPGDLILAESVASPEGMRGAASEPWRRRLLALFGTDAPAGGSILGTDRPISSVQEKAMLFAATGASAVDMESHGVALAAAATGLPLLMVRAIADPASRALPRAALTGLAPDGRRRPIAVAASLLLRPWELPDVLQLAKDSAAGLAALRGIAARGFLTS